MTNNEPGLAAGAQIESRARLASFWRALRQTLHPSPAAWRGATFGVVAAIVLLALLMAWEMRPWPLGFALWAVLVLGLTAALANLILDVLLPKLPAAYRNVAIGAAVVLGMMVLGGVALPGKLVVGGALVVGASLVGGGAYVLIARPDGFSPGKAAGAIVAGAVILVALALFYRWPGPEVAPATRFAASGASLPPENPAQPGPYDVLTLTYGSGDDRRAVYDTPDLLSRRVDGDPYIANWDGLSGDLRTRYWGFGEDELPLNARVWYPAGEGPFPLVLIVHGNHEMTAPSEAGYAYLGELLASRGMILVSVDENFLNGAWTDRLPFGEDDGLQEENDARGWLLLEHLRLWQDWNADEEHPFGGLVDMGRIALIGHSRGGEAAAVAAALNELPHYPEDARQRFDYGFNIRAVVAIAPADGQYEPAGRPTPLEGPSYLVLQGAYDGDVYYFDGIAQYNRVTLPEGSEAFKAAVYVDRANHGQFNTEWGRSDRGSFPSPGIMNLGPIMDGEAQRDVARLFISAFLEATLNEREAYRVLFEQPGAAAPWLPDVAYRARFDAPGTRYLATFDEDLDVTTGTAPGVTLRGEGLRGWKEDVAPLKASGQDQQSAALRLQWDGGGRYEIALTDGEAGVGAGFKPAPTEALSLSLAAGEEVTDTLDFTIALVDEAGREARLPLSAVAPLPPPIPFDVWKHPLLSERGAQAEPVFQSYLLPLEAFEAETGFDVTALAAIQFIFDRSESGEMWVDDVGWR